MGLTALCDMLSDHFPPCMVHPQSMKAAEVIISSQLHSSGYDRVMMANREGRLGFFPSLLAFHALLQLALAGLVYWITLALT